MLGHPTHRVRPTHAPDPTHPSQPLDLALAWTGAVLATLPFVATVGLAIVGSIAEQRALFDWLMPAELAIATFVGALALVVVVWRSGLRRRAVGIALAASALFYALTAGVSIWTGLAEGTQAPEGWRLALVLTVYVAYVLAALTLAIEGWMIVRDQRRARASQPGPGARS